MVNRDRLLRTFLDLVRINSPSRAERGIADYVKPKLEEMGFDVMEDDAGARIGGNAGNIIATMKGSSEAGTPIFLAAHMDTVDRTEGIQLIVTEDGVVKTDGKTILGADDKAGIAAILEAAHVSIEHGRRFKCLQILFTVSEEIGLMGAKEVDPAALVGGVGYVLDTQKPVAGVVISAPTHENFLVKITGKASHAGMHPELGVSAIIAAANAISRMKLGRIDKETTANVGVISGGKARNIIPDEVVIRAEARSRNEEKLRKQVEHMTQVFREAAEEIGAKAEIEVVREYTTYRWTAEDAPVILAQKAAAAVGLKAELVHGGGGSDANIFNAKGVPAVVIGVGYEGAHSTDEHIAIDDLVKATEFTVALIAESGK